MAKLTLKQYIIRKFVMAVNAKDAMRKEKLYPAHEVWIVEKWAENNTPGVPLQVGFTHGKKEN